MVFHYIQIISKYATIKITQGNKNINYIPIHNNKDYSWEYIKTSSMSLNLFIWGL